MPFDRSYVAWVAQLHVRYHSQDTPHREVEQHQARNTRVEVVTPREDGRVGLNKEVDAAVDETHVRSYGNEHGLTDQNHEGLE